MSEVLEVPIGRRRVGRGARVSLEAGEPAVVEAKSRPPVIARTLALAHTMQAMIDRGEVKDQAELARMLGFTRARVTQMLDLTLLAPDIQEAILTTEKRDPRGGTGERAVRSFAAKTWSLQRRAWASFCDD